MITTMSNTSPTNYAEPSTPEERDRAKLLHSQGLNYEEISQEMGRASSTIHRWVKDYDNVYKIKEWKGKATQEEKDIAIQAYSFCQNIQKVCELTDRNYGTISRWLTEAEIDTSKPVTRNKSSKKVRDEIRDKAKLEKEIIKLNKRIAELETQNEELRKVVSTLASFNHK